MVVNKIILHNMIRARETPPPHGKCHFKIPFFGRLPLGRPKFGRCLPLFCFHDCSLFRSKPVSTSWCFGARAGALEHELVLCEFLSNLKPSEKDI